MHPSWRHSPKTEPEPRGFTRLGCGGRNTGCLRSALSAFPQVETCYTAPQRHPQILLTRNGRNANSYRELQWRDFKVSRVKFFYFNSVQRWTRRKSTYSHGAVTGQVAMALGPGGTWGLCVVTLNFSSWVMFTHIGSVIFGKIIHFFCALCYVTFHTQRVLKISIFYSAISTCITCILITKTFELYHISSRVST